MANVWIWFEEVSTLRNLMAFTDDNLNHIKIMIEEQTKSKDPKMVFTQSTIKAFLARLEAAETFALASWQGAMREAVIAEKAWRKSKGE
jgi:hypothetical protein